MSTTFDRIMQKARETTDPGVEPRGSMYNRIMQKTHAPDVKTRYDITMPAKAVNQDIVAWSDLNAEAMPMPKAAQPAKPDIFDKPLVGKAAQENAVKAQQAEQRIANYNKLQNLAARNNAPQIDAQPLPTFGERLGAGFNSIWQTAAAAVPMLGSEANQWAENVAAAANSKEYAAKRAELFMLQNGLSTIPEYDKRKEAEETAKTALQNVVETEQLNKAASPDAAGVQMMRAAKESQQRAVEGLSPVGQFIGNTLISVGQNAAMLPTALINPTAPLVGMGVIAAADKAYELTEQGVGAGEAFTRSIASGGIEALTEKLPLDNLLKMAKTPAGKSILKTLIKQSGKQVAGESVEEAASYALNYAADVLARDPNAKFSWLDLGLASLGGALSGGIMGGVATAIGSFVNGNAQNVARVQDSVQGMAQDSVQGMVQGMVQGVTPNAESVIETPESVIGAKENPANSQTVGDLQGESVSLPIDRQAENMRRGLEAMRVSGLVNNNEARAVNRRTRRALNAMGNKLGVKIMFDNTLSGENGRYDPAERTIHIALDSQDPIGVVATHEITHRLKETSPEIYQQFKQTAFDIMRENGSYDNVMAAVADAYADSDPTIIEDEMTAHFTRIMTEDISVFEQLAGVNRNLAQKLLDMLDELLRKAGWNDSMNAALDSLFGDINPQRLQNVRNSWVQALQNADAGADKRSDIKKSMPLDPNSIKNKNLMAIHNIPAENLNKAFELGGFPMPSIAVTKDSVQHNKFGDISLLFGKETIDPAKRGNKVYSADAWTPTFPEVEYEANPETERRIRDMYYRLSGERGNEFARPIYGYGQYLDEELGRQGGLSGVIDRLKGNTDMMQIYLAENGMPPVENIVKETVNKLPEEKTREYEFLINALGEDAFKEMYTQGGETPREAWDRWTAQHGSEFETAFINYLRSKGSMTEQQMSNMANSKFFKSVIRREALDTRRYLEKGPETISSEVDFAATRDAIKNAVDMEQYEKWLNKLFEGAVKNSGIYNNKERYTSSGKRRSFESTHYPVTLENIAKAMAGQNEGNAKNVMGYNGINTIRAATSESFKNIAGMHKSKGRLQQMSEEQAKTALDALADRLTDVIERIYNLVPHGAYTNQLLEYDAIGNIISEIGEGGDFSADNVKNTFAKYRYKLDDNIASEVENLLADTAKVPVNYFEAKPNRAVRFDEVKAAVVPQNTSSETVQRLKDLGIAVTEYDPEIEGDRTRKVSTFDELKFSRPLDPNAINRKADILAPLRERMQANKAATEQTAAPVAEQTAEPPKVKSQSLQDVLYRLKERGLTVTQGGVDITAGERTGAFEQRKMREYGVDNTDDLIAVMSPEDYAAWQEREAQDFNESFEALMYDVDQRELAKRARAAAKAPNEKTAELISNPDNGIIETDAINDSAQLLANVHFAGNKTISQNLDDAVKGAKGDLPLLPNQTRQLRQMLYNAIEKPLAKAKAKYIAGIKSKAGQFAKDMDRLGIKAGSQESAAVQWIGEGQRQGPDGEAVEYTLADLQQQFPNSWQNIVEAAQICRRIYDAYVSEINEALRKVYPDVERRAMELADKLNSRIAYNSNQAQIWLDRASQLEQKAANAKAEKHKAGTMAEAKAAERANRLNDQAVRARETANRYTRAAAAAEQQAIELQRGIESGEILRNKRLLPRKDYFHHFNEMEQGLGGFVNILTGSHDISAQLAGKSEFTKPKSKWWGALQHRNNGKYTADAVGGMAKYIPAAEYKIAFDPYTAHMRGVIEQLINVTEKTKNTNSLIEYLTDYTNDLAGKTNFLDRPIQKIFDRRSMKALEWLNNRAKANAVAGNIGSALVQIGNIPNAMIFIGNPAHWAQAAQDIATGQSKESESVFLNERYINRELDKLQKSNALQNISNWMLEVGDKQAARLIWNAAYHQYESGNYKGMRQYENAADYADDITRRSIGGRGVGEMALTQKSRIVKLFAPFQVEVNNTWNLLAEKLGERDAAGLMRYAVGAWAINSLLYAITGRRALFDPIDALIDAIKGAVDDDEEDRTTAEKLAGAVQRIGGEVVSNMPYASTAATMLTGADNSANIFGEADPTRYGTGNIAVQSIAKPVGQLLSGQNVDLLPAITSFALPYGGKQAERTIEGAQALGMLPYVRYNTKDGLEADRNEFGASRAASGRIRFPITKPSDQLRALTLGEWSTSGGREYLDEKRTPLSDKQTEAMEKMFAAGISPNDYYDAVIAAKKAVKKVDKDGKTVPLSEYRDKIKLINQAVPHLSDRERKLIYAAMGISKNAYERK